MKASEFVRRFGLSSLEIAKTLPKFNRYKYVIFYADEIDFSNKFHAGRKSYMFEVAEVKRLVESHELVERVGGLDRVKKALDGKHIGYTHFYLHSNDRYVFLDHYVDFIPDHAQHIGMFNKAIADVEACKEVL